MGAGGSVGASKFTSVQVGGAAEQGATQEQADIGAHNTLPSNRPRARMAKAHRAVHYFFIIDMELHWGKLV
jgi:hypothetical protein